jgi:SAM-dependent methyltransferase
MNRVDWNPMSHAPDNKAIYDSNWEEWESMKRYGPMSRHVRRLAFNECRTLTFDSLLDIGCGPGVFLDFIKTRFPFVSLAGTDISTSAISLARRHLPGCDFYEIDISRKVPPGSWDLVTMIDVAEHIEEDAAAFSRIRDICRKYLLIVTLEGRMRSFETEVGHVRNYKPGELRTKLENAGYSVVRCTRWGWPIYSPLYRDLSKGIAAHKKPLSAFRRFMANLVYAILLCNWPGKGDLIIVLAAPDGK